MKMNPFNVIQTNRSDFFKGKKLIFIIALVRIVFSILFHYIFNWIIPLQNECFES